MKRLLLKSLLLGVLLILPYASAEDGIIPVDAERRGCCSHHSGVCGCSGGRAACCDGTLSPSCGCNLTEQCGQNTKEEQDEEAIPQN